MRAAPVRFAPHGADYRSRVELRRSPPDRKVPRELLISDKPDGPRYRIEFTRTSPRGIGGSAGEVLDLT